MQDRVLAGHAEGRRRRNGARSKTCWGTLDAGNERRNSRSWVMPNVGVAMAVKIAFVAWKFGGRTVLARCGIPHFHPYRLDPTCLALWGRWNSRGEWPCCLETISSFGFMVAGATRDDCRSVLSKIVNSHRTGSRSLFFAVSISRGRSWAHTAAKQEDRRGVWWGYAKQRKCPRQDAFETGAIMS